MALKALMLRKKLDDANSKLEELRSKSAEFETREAELTEAINEASTDEERAAVEESVTAFESEKTETADQIASLEREVEGIEAELSEAEEAQNIPAEAPAEEVVTPEVTEERTEKKGHVRMNRSYKSMSFDERTSIVEREDVKEFLTRTREAIANKRTVSGATLAIPTVILDLVREDIGGYSKLYNYVRVRQVSGKARQTVLGAIPEGVWTEMCGILNDADISFTGVEVDAYKVGAYIPVCNAALEDSDIDLAAEIIDALAQGLGLALDKAILYGTGTKMPKGIVTRLAETAAPADYPATARAWADLHTSNVVTIAASVTGADLFAAIVSAFAAAKNGDGSRFFAMNHSTKMKLLAASLAVNSAGALVGGFNDEMPAVGGTIIELNFIPDDVIVGGYGDRYLVAERADVTVATSSEVHFIEDETVFKATARYDGLPVIAEAFVAIGINGETVDPTDVTFAPDVAN